MPSRFILALGTTSVLVGMSGLSIAAIHHRTVSAPTASRVSYKRATGNSSLVVLGSRDELVAVLIASSHCSGSLRPDFVPAVLKMKRALAFKALSEHKRLVTVGAATDDSKDDGLTFLNMLGPFDEIVLGGNWLNEAATQYIWRDQPGVPAVPQWVLLERHVDINRKSINVGAERVVDRVIGANGMLEWLKRNKRSQVSN